MESTKRKESKHSDPTYVGSLPHHPAQHTVTVGIPAYRNIPLRSRWLVTMFFVGALSQYLLAIYTPGVWNYIFSVLKNVAPVI